MGVYKTDFVFDLPEDSRGNVNIVVSAKRPDTIDSIYGKIKAIYSLIRYFESMASCCDCF